MGEEGNEGSDGAGASDADAVIGAVLGEEAELRCGEEFGFEGGRVKVGDEPANCVVGAFGGGVDEEAMEGGGAAGLKADEGGVSGAVAIAVAVAPGDVGEKLRRALHHHHFHWICRRC